MIEPSEQAAPQLVGWKRPNHAYILLEIPQRNIVKDGEFVYGRGLVTLNAEGRAEMAHQVDIYLKKGGRVLDYGNFPKLTSADPKRAEKARIYSQGAGDEPWGPLESYLKQKMRDAVDFQKELRKKDEEMDALRAKVAALESKKQEKPAKDEKPEKPETAKIEKPEPAKGAAK